MGRSQEVTGCKLTNLGTVLVSEHKCKDPIPKTKALNKDFELLNRYADLL